MRRGRPAGLYEQPIHSAQARNARSLTLTGEESIYAKLDP
jgi:hypothetical protein